MFARVLLSFSVLSGPALFLALSVLLFLSFIFAVLSVVYAVWVWGCMSLLSFSATVNNLNPAIIYLQLHAKHTVRPGTHIGHPGGERIRSGNQSVDSVTIAVT